MSSLRGLRRSPGFVAAAVLTLALGTGVNTAAFSALYKLLLKPLPYPEPDRLVSLYETTVDRKPRGVAEANLLDWRARTTVFESMAVYQARSFLMSGAGNRVIQTGMVMADFFRVLNVAPARGRVFTEAEEISGTPLIVITERLWRASFAADPAVIGRTVELNEEPHTIIGVMPSAFEYPMDRVLPDAFIPLSRKDYCCGRLGSQNGIARLKPGVTLDRARTELASVAAGLALEYPATNAGRTAGLEALEQAQHGRRREPLYLLLAACAGLLAISCANVAGLVLARCLARNHETAIRIALGASTARLARQWLSEAAILSVGGAAVGMLAAKLVLDLIPQLVPNVDPAALRLDGLAFGISLALAVIIAILIGSVPLLWFRRSRPRSHIRPALVVTQIALSVVLLLATGVLLRSFSRLLSTSPGFTTEHAWRFGIGLPEKRYDDDLKLIDFHRHLLDKFTATPGIAAAGAALRLPLRGGTVGPGGSFQIMGSDIPIPQRPRAWVNAATPGYFEAMGIPLIEGRTFSWRDDVPRRHRVAVVNETFARTYLRDRQAVSTLLDIRWVSELNPLGVPWEIVGVVADTRQANLDREPIPEIFLSMSQVGSEGAVYVIRTRGDTGTAQQIARIVEAQDPRLEQISVQPLRDVIDNNLEARAAAMRLIAVCGGLALLLTAIGIYGIVAFRASERTREMAIRSALGGTPSELRNLVFAHSARLALCGVTTGLVGFRLATPLLKNQLYCVAPFDAFTVVLVSVTVVGVSIAAAIPPGRRASHTAPMDLFRDA